MRGRWIGGGILLILAACTAQSSSKVEPPPALAAADHDHDGHVTQVEWDAETQRLFNELDANHDGKIDASELRQHVMALDANHDGAIDNSEAPGVVRAADSNGDGRATPAELAAANWNAVVASMAPDSSGISYQTFATARSQEFAARGLPNIGRGEREPVTTPSITVWRF